MKKVKITIHGDLLALDYCNVDKEFLDEYYYTCAWDKVEAMYINGNEEENVVKKKGKYVKTKEYFHDLFSADGDHPLPVECHARIYQNVYADYEIKLEDNEEFDIKKVQLVKSDYECDAFPYFIIAGNILYDGKEVITYDLDEFCPEEKMYSEFIIDSLY